jgi:hypothetical protein
MARLRLFLLLLLAMPAVGRALPTGCSVLAAGHTRDLWILEPGRAARRLLAADRPIWAAAWSPDGRVIAFGGLPADTSTPTELTLADREGTVLRRFPLDKPQGEGGARFLGAIEWRGPRTLVAQVNMGPHGGYADVWRLSADLTRADRIRRVGVVGGACVSSPSAQYLACPGYGGIWILDTLYPPDETGEVWEDHPFETPRLALPYESGEEAEVSDVAWSRDGASVFAVSRLHTRRFLTAIDKSPGPGRGWNTTDRELSGIDSPVLSVAVEPDVGLLLFSDEQVYRIDAKAAKARRGEVAAVRAPAELLRPRTLEIEANGAKLRLDVLDIRCGNPVAQR